VNVPQSTELRTLYDAMDNAARNCGKRATVAELVIRTSGRRPRLLVIEDLHWADQMTLDHAANLAETIPGCPALLVMTSRIERDARLWWRRARGNRKAGLPSGDAVEDLRPRALPRKHTVRSGSMSAESSKGPSPPICR
jgi:hypothetical protein